jgi:protein-disulfide isomerase
LGLVALLGLGVFWLIYQNWVPIPESEKNKEMDRIESGDWFLGEKTAPIVVIEYSDFQCPACKVFEPELKRLSEAYKDVVVLVYRHFPLKQIHLQAELAARAAEAAGMQGKFWEMHDKLFEGQEEWSENRGARSMFIKYAAELGLDEQRFIKDIDSREVKALVKADYMSALGQRLNATPSLLLNGKLIENPSGFEGLAEYVETLLREASAGAELKTEE